MLRQAAYLTSSITPSFSAFCLRYSAINLELSRMALILEHRRQNIINKTIETTSERKPIINSIGGVVERLLAPIIKLESLSVGWNICPRSSLVIPFTGNKLHPRQRCVAVWLSSSVLIWESQDN